MYSLLRRKAKPLISLLVKARLVEGPAIPVRAAMGRKAPRAFGQRRAAGWHHGGRGGGGFQDVYGLFQPAVQGCAGGHPFPGAGPART